MIQQQLTETTQSCLRFQSELLRPRQDQEDYPSYDSDPEYVEEGHTEKKVLGVVRSAGCPEIELICSP